jgi:hypothetical protein
VLVQEVVDNFFVIYEVTVHLTKQLLIAQVIVIFRILIQLWSKDILSLFISYVIYSVSSS